MTHPERRDPRPGAPERSALLSPEERRQVARAAALRPLNVLVLVIGAGIFATTLTWWVAPLTLVTYALLVFLAFRDPVFGRRILHGGEGAARSLNVGSRDVSPERRARWLPRGETRQKVEAALVVYRKVVTAIEESDDVTRAVLGDVVPKLHSAANRLVDVAQGRERAAEVLRDLRRDTGTPAGGNARQESIQDLQDKLRAADAEISETFEKLLTLRSRVVRVSIDSGDPEQANLLNASLEELNARLEALSDVVSPPSTSSERRLRP
jgi:hypothetical protein